MAQRNRAVVVTRWDVNSRAPACLADIPANSAIGVTDITGQDGAIIPPTPNVYFVQVDNLTNGQLTALKAMTQYFVLMDAQYDNVTGVISTSTYDDSPTAPQMLTFKNTIEARFPDVDDDKLTDAGQLILQSGKTRRQALTALIVRWRRFAHA